MESMDFFIVLFTILLIFIHLRKRNRGPKLKLPPGPFAWPILGNFHQLGPVHHQYFADLSKIYGPIVSFWYGSGFTVTVSNASLAREVLKDRDHEFANRPRIVTTKVNTKDGADLIWADYGPHFVKLKKVAVNELFSPRSLRGSAPIREEEMATLVRLIRKQCEDHSSQGSGKSLELRKYLNTASFNVIGRLLLGKKFIDDEGVITKEGAELKDIMKSIAIHNSKVALMDVIPFLKLLWTVTGKGSFLKSLDRKKRFFLDMIEECKAEVRKNGASSEQHFLGALFSLRDSYDLSEDNIVGILWDMITAGLDTSVVAVEWAIAHLVKSYEMQQMAQTELDSVIGSNKVLTEQDFPRLPYLKCIVKETLRLHPSTPQMLPHQVSVDTKLGIYDIPKGTNVHVNVWAIARDPTVWKDPTAFQPERFLTYDVDMTGRDFRFLPFGSGRRMCPGAQLGINLVMLMLGRLLHHYSWGLDESSKVEDMDMSDAPGLVCSMRSPLRVIPTPRLPTNLYKK